MDAPVGESAPRTLSQASLFRASPFWVTNVTGTAIGGFIGLPLILLYTALQGDVRSTSDFYLFYCLPPPALQWQSALTVHSRTL
jgi:hypothetical protein